jgi:3'-phosphoadenosine 5'-phosphosulfate sulfotransferase (PAPS reductase)/FAD synthetase
MAQSRAKRTGGQMKNQTLTLTAPIHAEIANQSWDKIIVSVSGGKDSAVLLAWACDNFPIEKLVAVHATIDIDWNETLPVVRRQCKQFNVPLVEVCAIDKDGNTKGFLDQLTAKRVNRKTGEVGEYQFPSMSNRWCTSVLKTGPIDKYARTLRGNILVLIGERREESANRAKLDAVRPDEKNSIAGRTIVKYSPILDMLETQVWAVIDEMKIEKHPCYGWGVTRASCAICIFSSNREIRIAAERAPEIVAKYIEAEKQIQHAFRYKPATKKRGEQRLTIEQIVNGQDE